MKLTKKEKRMGALNRFKIMSKCEWIKVHPEGTDEQYVDYITAKNVELDSLKESLNAH